VVVEVKYAPGSSQWTQLYTAYGYSNYGVTQLRAKGYSRYADLVKLNAAIIEVVNAKTVTQSVYNELMARWNSFVNDPAFVAVMKNTVPGGNGKK